MKGGVARLRILTWVVVLGSLFPAVGALRSYAGGAVVDGSRAVWIGIFGNPNELAFSLVVLVPFAAYLAVGGSRIGRVAVLGVAALDVAAIVVTQSRGGLIGLLVVVALAVLRLPDWRPRLLAGGIALAVLLFAGQFWGRDEGFHSLSGDASVHQRLDTIRAGFAMLADRPLTGVGLGCSAVGWPLYSPAGPRSAWLHVHNTFVQVLTETGVVGFLPFTLLLGTCLWQMRKLGRPHHPRPVAGLASLAQRVPRPSPDEAAGLAAATETAMWGMIACGMSGGYALSWFPYILFAFASALRRAAPQATPQ